ncbi:hypothetical protein Q4491_19000 [Photobacterium sp. 2_MG-2023]|uniref:hypothetical protein n=1 Tax=Photobacterium sp. 2_MG-2023 TaxID=3062663 RepID=UPI0026E20CA7|nr:hypothetical protein [Photobacterium sp. 2_MG-2023]MDO6583431.1 hypothetical protein [Photobacterium sp. 2_MG-2023]
MMWLLTAIYFLLYSFVLWGGFIIYGKSLLYLGKSGGGLKFFGGFIIYAVFSCVLVSPLFLALTMIDDWRESFKLNPIYTIYFFVLFLLASVPGGIYFKKHYLSDLKKLGYFAQRR